MHSLGRFSRSSRCFGHQFCKVQWVLILSVVPRHVTLVCLFFVFSHFSVLQSVSPRSCTERLSLSLCHITFKPLGNGEPFALES